MNDCLRCGEEIIGDGTEDRDFATLCAGCENDLSGDFEEEDMEDLCDQ